MIDSPHLLLSVFVPVYGVEKYIERCARSLFEQTLKDGIEFIFVDDCSPDGSIQILEEILKEYPERKNQVKILRHPSNRGLAASRLTALNEAKGEFVIPCDSDDWVESDMYEKMLNKAIEEKADIVISDYFESYDKKEIPKLIPTGGNKFEVTNKILRNDIPSYLWHKMVKRDLYIRLKPSFTEGVNFWEDVSVISRIVYTANKISFISEPLYHYYRQNQNSYTVNKKNNHSLEIFKTLEILYSFFKDKGVDLSPQISRGFNLILKQENRKGRKFYRKELKNKIHIKPKSKHLIGKINSLCGWCYFHKLDFSGDIINRLYNIYLNRVKE